MTRELLHELLRPYGTFDVEGPEELRALIAGRGEDAGQDPAAGSR